MGKPTRFRALLGSYTIVAVLTAVAPAPNGTILLANGLRYRDVGCYDGLVRRPAVDSLVADGIRCTDFYSATIENTDRAVARLLDKVAAIDRCENTFMGRRFRLAHAGRIRGTGA
jgi:hypothetical protein